jgi:hypothetical protein
MTYRPGRQDFVAHQRFGELDGVQRVIAVEDLGFDLGELPLGKDAGGSHDRHQVARDARR